MNKVVKSTSTHAILDPASRKRKAEKIVQVLRQKTTLKNAKLLDIGTGSGYIAHHLAGYVGSVTSVDMADERKIKTGYRFVRVDSEVLPFAPSSFDVVISNHVVEHVADQQRHISELLRVLRPGGLAYVATPNRNWPTDPHYRLPFINWLPRPLATAYLRAVKGQTWDIYPINSRRFRQYAGRQHQLEPVVVDIIKNPELYNLDTLRVLHPFTKRLPRPLLGLLSHMSPTILLVLTKNSSDLPPGHH